MKGLNRMVIPSFFFLLVLIIPVLGYTWGYGEPYDWFNVGDSIWDSVRNLDAYRAYTNPYYNYYMLSNPVYGDVDDDGVTEFLFINQRGTGSVSLIVANKTGTSIRVEASYTLPRISSYRFSPINLWDADSDGVLEIGVAWPYTNMVHFAILNHNGTALNSVNATPNPSYGTHTFAHTGQNYRYIQMLCGWDSSGYCVILSQKDTGVIGAIFDENGLTIDISPELTLSTSSWPQGYQSIYPQDIDADGLTEIVTITPYNALGGTDGLQYVSFEINSSYHIRYERWHAFGQDVFVGTTGTLNDYNFRFTNSITYDFRSDIDSTNAETIIFYLDAQNKICARMWSYDWDSLFYRCYSILYPLDGWYNDGLRGDSSSLPKGYLSNLIRTDIDGDGDKREVCFMRYGFNADDDGLWNDNALICFNPQSEKIYIYTSDDYGSYEGLKDSNYTMKPMQQDCSFNLMIWESDVYSSVTLGSPEYPTFITPFGSVFFTSSSTSGSNDLYTLTENTNEENDVLFGIFPFKEEGEPYFDLIFSSNSSLFIMDDEYTNFEPTISNFEFNPGLDYPVGTNVTGTLTLKFADAENDLVSCKVVMYEDSVHEYSTEWQANLSQGVNIINTLEYNVTGLNYKMGVYWTDDASPYTISYDYVYFSVADGGSEYGENIDSGTGLPSGRDEEEEGEEGEDDSVTNLLEEIDEGFGLNLGTSVLWMAIIVIVAGYVWIKGSDANPMATLGVIAFLVMFLVVIGVTLGFIDAWLLVLIIVLAIAVISFSFIGWWRGG